MTADAKPPEYLAWANITPEEVLPGITRQTIHGAHQSMVRYLYAPGTVFPTHAHPEEQVTTVIRGRIAFQVGDQLVELGPGQVVIIPPHLPHGARVIGTETVETFNALSPRRIHAPQVSDGDKGETE